MCGFTPHSLPPRKRGPRNRDGAAATERTSAQWVLRRNDAKALWRNSTLPAAEALAAGSPCRRHPLPGGRWLPASAGRTGVERGGGRPAAADRRAVGVPRARWSGCLGKQPRPCRRVLCGPSAVSPSPVARWSRGPGFRRENVGAGKRGPRNRDGAAATERTSAQWVLRRHDAQALLKDSTLCAAEAVVVRCPFGRHPMLGGPWVPAFAGKTRG